MDDMINAVNEKAATVETMRRKLQESKEAQYQERLIRARKRATRAVILRGIVSLLTCVLLWILMGFELVAQPLALICMVLVLMVQVFHIGAWVQFIYAKGGYLNVTQ